MSASPVLFGITTWVTWSVRPTKSESGEAKNRAISLPAVVSPLRLMELGPLLQAAVKAGDGLDVHQLLRFNLLNLGLDSATVCGIALTGNREVLRCEVAPSVVVRAGARYPFTLEVRSGLVSETVDIQVERATGERAWIPAASLPIP